MADGMPLSGTPSTRSASAGASRARMRPMLRRAWYTDWPSMTESGRAK